MWFWMLNLKIHSKLEKKNLFYLNLHFGCVKLSIWVQKFTYLISGLNSKAGNNVEYIAIIHENSKIFLAEIKQ